MVRAVDMTRWVFRSRSIFLATAFVGASLLILIVGQGPKILLLPFAPLGIHFCAVAITVRTARAGKGMRQLDAGSPTASDVGSTVVFAPNQGAFGTEMQTVLIVMNRRLGPYQYCRVIVDTPDCIAPLVGAAKKRAVYRDGRAYERVALLGLLNRDSLAAHL